MLNPYTLIALVAAGAGIFIFVMYRFDKAGDDEPDDERQEEFERQTHDFLNNQGP